MKIGIITLDLETTGVRRLHDEPWSCSYARDIIEDGRHIESRSLRTFYIEHSVMPSPWVLKNTDYSKHFSLDDDFKPQRRSNIVITQQQFIEQLRRDLRSFGEVRKYLAGANPWFDDIFIERIKNRYPSAHETGYDYHAFDVENMALGFANGLDLISMASPGVRVSSQLEKIRHTPPRLHEAYNAVAGRSCMREDRVHDSVADVIATRGLLFVILGIDAPPIA